MPASKPMSRHQASFSSEPAIATARQPVILAIWPTNWPTAPDAADTTTVSPGRGRPTSSRPK
jgi:hypothetical protein